MRSPSRSSHARSTARSPAPRRHADLHRRTTGFVGTDSFTFTAADAYGTSSAGDGLDHRDRHAAADVCPTPSPRARTSARPRRRAGQRHRRGSGTLDPTTLAIVTPPTNGTAVVESGRDPLHAGRRSHPGRPLHLQRVRHGRRLRRRLRSQSRPSCRTIRRSPSRDSYDIAAGTTLHPAAPGVLANDTDPDAGRPHAGAARARRDERDAAAQQHRRVHLHAARSRDRHVRLPRRRPVGRGLQRRHRHDRT